MTWLRWDIQTPRHRVIGRLATELNVRRAEAVGLYFSCCLGFGENQTDGRPAAVTAHDLESWAFWTGKRGKFAKAFQALCVADGSEEDDPRDIPGVIRGWWRQDAIIRKQIKDASRPPSHLRNTPHDSPEIPAGEYGAFSGGDGGRRTEDGNGDELLPTTLPGRLAEKLIGSPVRYAIVGFLDSLPPGQPFDKWAMTLNGCLEGLGLDQGRRATVEELAAACNDYLGAAPGEWGIPHFRSFVDRVVAKRFRPRKVGARTPGHAERTLAAAAEFVARKRGEG